MEIYTIGFAKKPASEFFNTLREAGISLVIDVRLHNVSQMAAFTKRDDLRFFLKEIIGADYLHETSLAPTEEMLDSYRKKQIGWPEFESLFAELLKQRQVEDTLDRSLFDKPVALLCSEATADKCHRRLVAEYLAGKWGDVRIVHLGEQH